MAAHQTISSKKYVLVLFCLWFEVFERTSRVLTSSWSQTSAVAAMLAKRMHGSALLLHNCTKGARAQRLAENFDWKFRSTAFDDRCSLTLRESLRISARFIEWKDSSSAQCLHRMIRSSGTSLRLSSKSVVALLFRLFEKASDDCF